ncbi:flagellar filament capping protein FliD [Acanthopleuribacter pedis]|uniref:Flagellar hook-associated protein 2 n=1 Tax=Acanthopleuribacter pedis TaxID=442870 RepID=A0A8J7U5A6_9BACT|nr:flagellar filament capping protein FliD [Acanthopleuribacter pedis]MBO1319116.1 flagellar filament capping protein FliD [Acanthopleuribacter pedis]
MSGIQFNGLATGLDYEALKDALLARYQRRADKISTNIVEQNQTKGGLSDLKRVLGTFGNISEKLDSDVFEKRIVESSDEKIFTANAINSDAANGEYELTVSQLASNSVATIGTAQTSANDVIGAGTFNIETANGSSYNVNLTDAGSTLADLRQAINDQHGENLNANIIEVQSGSFQLVVSTAESGADNNIIVGAGQSEITGFDAGFLGGGVVNERTGLNAIFEVDGIQIQRSSNEVTDVIDGITLTLRNTSEVNTKQSLRVANDFDGMIAGAKEFLAGYNDVLTQIGNLTNAEAGGVLSGDSSILDLGNQLRSLISRAIPNAENLNRRDDGSIGFTALSQIGFKSDSETGQLSLDETKFKEALTDNFSEVKNLFLGSSTSSNANVNLVSDFADTPFSGSINLDTINDTATVDGTTYNLNRTANALSFQSGSPYEGLSFFAGASVASVDIEVSAGLGKLIENLSDTYAGFSGIFDDRTESIDNRNRQLERDLDRANTRVDDERARLDRIFARAETAVSQLQGLQSSLGAQTIAR